jgi:hypothetical protein
MDIKLGLSEEVAWNFNHCYPISNSSILANRIHAGDYFLHYLLSCKLQAAAAFLCSIGIFDPLMIKRKRFEQSAC